MVRVLEGSQAGAVLGGQCPGLGDARAGARNPVTGKAVPGRWYAPAAGERDR